MGVLDIIVLNHDRYYIIKVSFNKLGSAIHEFFFLLLISYFDNVMAKFIVNNTTH